MKKILILAFKFPPFQGVSSRRWAKFSRILAESGHIVYVVTTTWPEDTDLSWKKDIDHENINIIKIKSFGFHHFSRRLFNNLMLKILQRILKKFLSYLYFIDETQFWNFSLIPACKSIIRSNNIELIIATGQPFMVNYHACKLKIFPRIPLINDFRDAWNEGPIKKYRLFYSMSVKFQLDSLKTGDVITVVSNGMKTNLLQFFPEINPDKIVVIYNGFNESDFSIPPSEKKNDLFKIIYAGGLGFGRINGITLLFDAIIDLINTKKINENMIQFSYFGNQASTIPHKYQRQNWVQIEKQVTPEEVMKTIRQSDLLTIFNSKIFPYALSSKLFENIRSGIPTLAISLQAI